MDKDGMDARQIKRNAGEDELTLSMSEAFDHLEKEGTLPDPIKKKVEEPVNEEEVSEKTGRKVPQQQEEPKEEPKDEPNDEPNEEPKEEPVEEEPVIEEEESSYELDELNKLAGEEEAKKPEHSRADDDDAKEEIEEIRSNPHTPEKTKKGIDRLLGNNNRLKKFLEEERSKVASLEAEVENLKNSTPKENPISEQERHELNMLRMKHNIGSDENIRKNYDEPISATENKIYKIVDRALAEDQAKQVKDMGFENFARRFPTAYRELLTNLQEDSPLDASILSSSVNDLVTLRSSREAAVEKMTADADKYFENQQQSIQQAMEKRKTDLEQLKKDTYDNLVANNPLYRDIPTNDLAGEELQLAQRENKLRSVYRQKAQEFINVNTVEGQQKMIAYATLSFRLADRVKQLAARVKQLESNKKEVVDARKLKKGKETPTPKEEAPPPPSSFSEAIDQAAHRRPVSPLRSTRSIPR